jgi:glutathione S-transferase
VYAYPLPDNWSDAAVENFGDFVYPGIVSSLALLLYYFTLFMAAMGRAKYNVAAPSHDGPEPYLRRVRVHQNTLEHLALFLPGLWLFSVAVDPIWAAGIGVLWLVGRIWFAFGYYQAAEKRGLGLYMSMPPIYIYVLGSLIGFVIKVF